MEELRGLLFKESKKVENYKHKVLKETGSVLVVTEELDINAANDLGITNTIRQKDLDEFKLKY